jgi:hypothetical protein
MVDQFQGAQLTQVSLKSDKVEVRKRSSAKFEPRDIAERFRKQERLDLGEAVELIEAARSVLREEQVSTYYSVQCAVLQLFVNCLFHLIAVWCQ